MEMFEAVMFSTIDDCNRSCSWCPNKTDLRKTKEAMTSTVRMKLLKELASIGFEGTIAPFGLNEPLMDPELNKVIIEIRETLPKCQIVMHTNGDKLLHGNTFELIMQSPLNELKINWYGSDEDYQQLKYKLLAVNHATVVETFNSKTYPKDNLIHVEMRQIKEPLQSFWNRGGNVDIRSSFSLRFCPFIFKWLTVNHRGDVYLCCSDWKYEVTFGNIMERPILDIWNDKKFEEYREAHMHERGKSMPLCGKCDLI